MLYCMISHALNSSIITRIVLQGWFDQTKNTIIQNSTLHPSPLVGPSIRRYQGQILSHFLVFLHSNRTSIFMI